MARKPTDTVQLKLRFPESLRRRLERAASRHGRSMNSEIVVLLTSVLDREEEHAMANDVLREVERIARALNPEEPPVLYYRGTVEEHMQQMQAILEIARGPGTDKEKLRAILEIARPPSEEEKK